MTADLIPKVDGLQFMPVLENKRPIFDNWQTDRKEYDFSNAKAIGLVCGIISDYVQAIDVDLKYDLTGVLFEEYKKSVGDIDKNLLKKLTVQTTVSGGYHLIFKCKTIEGNKKLAERFTTAEEKRNTFLSTYKSEAQKLKKVNPNITEDELLQRCTTVAHNSSENDKVRVLLETRGDKGYIACFPTKGYELKYGSFDKIQFITEQERETLFEVARSFTEVFKEFQPKKPTQRKLTKGDTPLEDFDKRGDVVALLEEYGWEAVGRKGQKILMKRPGDTKATHSGNFDEERNWFSVFSTSTEFEAQTAYRPYAVYCILKCKGDWAELPKRLASDGYGTKQENIVNTDIPSIIDTTDNDLSFLATPCDYDDYLDRWRKGTFEMGKSTGIPTLDPHFLFKEGNLVILNGIDNTGKSSVVWYFGILSAIFHGWKWLIFSSENRAGGVMRKLIEFYWSEPIDQMSDEKYFQAKKFVENNFDIIKVTDKLYNYQDILNMTTLAFKKHKYRGLMIDPYNSLKVDIPGTSRHSTYDYHYEAASVIQLYAKQNNISVYLNCHVGTVGARNKDKSGYTKAPQKEDTEMGVMFANKADEFITIHRVTQHETDWKFTEIHVRKVKETETGGRVTFFAKPIDIKMVNNLSGFETCPSRNEMVIGYNPILEFHRKNKPAVDYSEPIKEFKITPSKEYDKKLTTEPRSVPF